MRKFLTLLLCATAISGCATTSRYTTPQVQLPAQYAQGSGQVSSANQSQDRWWEAFGDARLTALVDRVLAQNNNLAAATILVRRAQLQAGLASDALLPHADAGVTSSVGAGQSDQHSASASVSWEVDLFGRLGAERDAARWEAGATAQDLAATRLSLIGTTLDLYWQLAQLNEQISLGDSSVTYAEDILKLVSSQRAAGAVSAIELSEARQSVESQKASLETLKQSRTETRTALAMLLGQAAWSEADEPTALPRSALPQVKESLPAELLSRRPDVRAAELRLREGLSTVDADRASFYPSLTLTGSAGGSSAQLSNVLANPISALGVGINLPFLNFNQLNLQLKVSKADYERAVILFRQTLLQAFGDVENALSAQTRLASQGQSLEASLQAAREAERLYGVRYRAGAVPLRTYLDAQEQLRTAERTALQNRLDQLQARATLYEALGGG
ncbi:efflux transporter outer membrane subunit [Phenylobacterium sp.]|uniref:efflux transporter outer membrane subunit n=1 Tax=Phenylobacterium sp. TaxID=1871053 RepID=UPI0025DA41B4|nr:efflux transporter outer membrane subunit [Phenylobacterium sp.]